MIRKFRDNPPKIQHDAFQAWRRGNLGGFFVNMKTRTSGVVHRVTCEKHHGDCNWPYGDEGSLTTNGKVVSASLADLEAWAAASGVAIKRCTTCDPFPDT